MEWIIVSLASLLAGFVDAIVGGGGLILVPALFATFPNAPPATLLGTNKSGSIWGTAIATWQYSRRVQIRWQSLLPAAAAGFAGGFAGAWTVTVVPVDFLRRILPFILLAVLLYTLARKDLGKHHAPRFEGAAETRMACLIGLAIGFYDGFFGPGTGSFFVFLFVRLLGYDFLNASASAKLLNLATNVAALILFTAKGAGVVALRAAAGGGQRGGQRAGHAHGDEARHGLRARHFHPRRGGADPQDGL